MTYKLYSATDTRDSRPMLLSALESWSFAEKHRLPDYLQERLCESTEVLRREILGEEE
jgi:hypothetical protein